MNIPPISFSGINNNNLLNLSANNIQTKNTPNSFKSHSKDISSTRSATIKNELKKFRELKGVYLKGKDQQKENEIP
jgi:hypothetical protein